MQLAATEPDPYTVLGVGRTATAAEIRAAYRVLATRYHPDRHQGNPLAPLAGEKLTEINRAYQALSTPAQIPPILGPKTRAARAYQATVEEGIAGPLEGKGTSRKSRSIIIIVALLPLVIGFGDVTARTIRSFIVELLGGLALIEDSTVAAVLVTLVLTLVLLLRARHGAAVKHGEPLA